MNVHETRHEHLAAGGTLSMRWRQSKIKASLKVADIFPGFECVPIEYEGLDNADRHLYTLKLYCFSLFVINCITEAQ
jgi:hypothetical protein